MNTELLILFIVLSITNVVISTIKSICTIKAGKGVAAIVSALAYSFNVIVVVYTVSDLPLLLKALVVGICNLIGVYFVKTLEEKLRKDKLWKIEATIPKSEYEDFLRDSEKTGVSHNYVDIQKYVLVNFYCSTAADTTAVEQLLKKYHAKHFVSESKISF